jgi:Zn-dependent peptidase ImmA (M78 family)/DNA-binding XRE family transcriptional regulator
MVRGETVMPGFNGNRLREMRVVRKMTLEQLAHSLGMTKQAVSKYEHGQSIPAPDTINKMLSILDMPYKYLCKEDVSYNTESSVLFFRTMSSTTRGNIDYADIISRWGYEILSALEAPRANRFSLPDTNDNLTVSDKALELRKHWGIGLLPIRNMTELLENNGIFVFVVDTADLKTDAYSRIINEIPIIVLNKSKGTAVRWRFSLAHELGHLFLHRGLSETEFALRNKECEDEANLFAEYFLMPTDGFRNSVLATKLEHFIPLKKEWGVSIAAMLYHCKRIGLINLNRINSLQIQMSKQGWKKKEPLDDEFEFECPQLLEKVISEQVTDSNSFSSFYNSVRLPINEIESLCSLPEGFFSAYAPEKETMENVSGNPIYEQLSLFQKGGFNYA